MIPERIRTDDTIVSGNFVLPDNEGLSDAVAFAMRKNTTLFFQIYFGKMLDHRRNQSWHVAEKQMNPSNVP